MVSMMHLPVYRFLEKSDREKGYLFDPINWPLQEGEGVSQWDVWEEYFKCNGNEAVQRE